MTILLYGDCLVKMQHDIEPGSVDMVLCDLPYKITQHDWDSHINLGCLFDCYHRVCKPSAAIVLFGCQPFTSALVAHGAAEECFRYSLVWRKNRATGQLNAKKQPLRIHEDISIFYRKPATYNPQMVETGRPIHAARAGKSKGLGAQKPVLNRAGATDRYPTTVLDFDVVNNDDPVRIHPSQKPVELLRYLIRIYTNPGQLVLDNAMGSGSTGVAALAEGRGFIGIEKQREFYDKAEAWIYQETPF